MLPIRHRLFLVTLVGSLLPPLATATERCTDWQAKVASLQGQMLIKAHDQADWSPSHANQVLCAGDELHVQANSRVALVLPSETIVRLDQNTLITLRATAVDGKSWLEIFQGIGHFISRVPHRLQVNTPFMNAGVEGTEFQVRVGSDQASVTVVEGKVRAENAVGQLGIGAGQTAYATSTTAPTQSLTIQPKDAVQWAMYYPPLSLSAETSSLSEYSAARLDYQQGHIEAGLTRLNPLPIDLLDPPALRLRAALRLAAGQVEGARQDLDRLLTLQPEGGDALAFLAIIAVAQHQPDQAHNLAKRAIAKTPDSAVAHLALSYAQQMQFDLDAARQALEKVARPQPDHAILWARLAELRLMQRDLNGAQQAARQAAQLDPYNAHSRSVLGFSELLSGNRNAAESHFQLAVSLDQAAPMPRLGLGLVKIRGGQVADGRRDMEIAAALDPANALLRSYLGKAYFDELRDQKAADQYALAKNFDANDPTPWLYEALLLETQNRPVEAVTALQESIDRNDNRAVYRSRLLLDEDSATRGTGLARIYNQLGFEQRALVEGWSSLATNPADGDAHRFLADSYAGLSNHQIARVSELLQAQLLQPLNAAPLQPQLAESKLGIAGGASYNDYGALYLHNGVTTQINGLAGNNQSLGNDAVVTALSDHASLSLGQFHYETEGFRPNNDQNRNIYTALANFSPSPLTLFQLEYRDNQVEKGDTALNFDPEDYSDSLRQTDKRRTWRLGARQSFGPSSQWLFSAMRQTIDSDAIQVGEGIPFLFDSLTSTTGVEQTGEIAELQYLLRNNQHALIAGAGYYRNETETTLQLQTEPPEACELIFTDCTPSTPNENTDQTSAYGYWQGRYVDSWRWTLGAGYDKGDDDKQYDQQVNPKLGLSWNPVPATQFRVAAFRTTARSLVNDQTLEPTQVAGFNQFFDDPQFTNAWRYGLGLDQRLNKAWFLGAEVSRRDLDVPYTVLDLTGESLIKHVDWQKLQARSYLYWMPTRHIATSTAYQWDDLKSSRELTNDGNILGLRTHRLPLNVRVFLPSGWFAGLSTTYVYQTVDFFDPGVPPDGLTTSAGDHGWLTDARIGYRLPRRFGQLSLEVKNLFNKQFQQIDPENPSAVPDRLIMGRFTINFDPATQGQLF